MGRWSRSAAASLPKVGRAAFGFRHGEGCEGTHEYDGSFVREGGSCC